jgi:hypothetical protein
MVTRSTAPRIDCRYWLSGVHMDNLRTSLLAVLIGALVGCGSGKPWDLVPVSGKITYEDGSLIPVNSMNLYFASQVPPADPKTFPRQGSVGVNIAEGTFQNPTTYKDQDGLIAGKHKVVVAAYDSGGRDLSPKVPREYASIATTPLEIDTADSPLEIKIRRP